MAAGGDEPVTAAGLGQLLAAARLELGAERHDALRRSLAGVREVLAQLDDVELGETPPATAFDARWR